MTVPDLHHRVTQCEVLWTPDKNSSGRQPFLRHRPQTWNAVKSVWPRSHQRKKSCQAIKDEARWCGAQLPAAPRQDAQHLQRPESGLLEEEFKYSGLVLGDNAAATYDTLANLQQLCTTVVPDCKFPRRDSVYDDAKLSYGIGLWLKSPRTGHASGLDRPKTPASKSEEEALKTLRWLLIEDELRLREPPCGYFASHHSANSCRNGSVCSPPPYSPSWSAAATVQPDHHAAVALDSQSLPQPGPPTPESQTTATAPNPPDVGIQSRVQLEEEAASIGNCETASIAPRRWDDLEAVESDGERSFINLGSWDHDGDESIDSFPSPPLPRSHLAIDSLVHDFASLFRSHTASSSADTSSRSSAASTRSSKPESHTSANTSVTGRSSAKRYRGDSDDRDGFDDDDRQSKRSKADSSSTAPQPPSLLACPYHKRDPARYSAQNVHEVHYRHCASTFSTSIPRLKQHLYRVHKRPDHYCSCCYVDFKTRDRLEEHVRQRSCRTVPSPFEERMTHDQMVAIKKRDVGRDPQTVWYNIYAILFPDCRLPDSPYVDNAAPDPSPAVFDLLRDCAPTMLATIIGAEADTALALTRTQRDVLDGIIEGSMARLFQQLGQQLNPPSATTPSTVPSLRGLEALPRPEDRHRPTSCARPEGLFSRAQQLPHPGPLHEPHHPPAAMLPSRPSMTTMSVHDPGLAWHGQHTHRTKPTQVPPPDLVHAGLPWSSLGDLSGSHTGQVQLGHTFTCGRKDEFEWEDFLVRGFDH